ncbi:DUF134 domain-containing protein [Marinisporobacter balticus]|uniref:UPF0251 protein EV214_11180 n=1 Tax=Marinisporobacter balticus TaxID=2018667 RepID=A0A4R2KQ63_9FIRM|nr:DUF134 domain-containing protein [Marinisporobacter balticus]TCO74817.1 putative DNA-binding protein (UPF0251 family) [Marinisporobacter balticus]
MARPMKPRKIAFMPENRYFIPVGKPKCHLEEIQLKLEEVEAMRLKDIEKLSQEECAEKMHVSRQTFQLIIDKARKKVAEALTEGKAINIQGGNYTLNICKYQCKNCDHEFNEAYEKEVHVCPVCNSEEVVCMDKGRCCMKACRRPWCENKEMNQQKK